MGKWKKKLNKPNFILNLAVESIKTYETTAKNSTCYNDAREGKGGIQHKVTLKTTSVPDWEKLVENVKKTMPIIENTENTIYTVSENVALLK